MIILQVLICIVMLIVVWQVIINTDSLERVRIDHLVMGIGSDNPEIKE